MKTLKQLALEEYNSEITTAHHGGGAGRPFWNIWSSQFMYNPSFPFAIAPGCCQYQFEAVDCNGEVHVFLANSPMSLLTPIWGELPEGLVELKVYALDKDNNPWTMVGARTFYKAAPFAGPENYPPKARNYRECALMAYHYAFLQPMIQHWLKKGTPDPDYDYYVYPSKSISGVIKAMIYYSKLDPEHADEAITIARNAADYLLAITFPENTPMAGLPPTYHIGFRAGYPGRNNRSAEQRMNSLMMIYPADVGSAYLLLEQATGEKRYYEGARRIAEYYREHVQNNGSWYLFVSVKTGEKDMPNYCVPDSIMLFLNEMYDRTGEEIWKMLELGCYRYMRQNCMELYNWEGQFEDSQFSENYSNLSHVCADSMISYLTKNKKDDPKAIKEAEDLMRFVEDQFVVWENFAPWIHPFHPDHGADLSKWYSPAGMEQYRWYMPIDASTAKIMSAFLDLYCVNKKPLLLAKACVLGDMITRMQNEKTGQIPTHWTKEDCKENGGNFWLNCHFATANAMFRMAEIIETEEKD